MIMSDALPGIKRFFRHTALSAFAITMLIRFAAAFIRHDSRMSASQAATAIRSQARHRAALMRFLAQANWAKDWTVLYQVATLLLQAESRCTGTWLFLLDQTFCGQQGLKTENTFSRGNYRQRPKKGQRRNKKRARRSCHCFVIGLLLTPSGLRVPQCRCYYTKDFCKLKARKYHTQTQLAAELIQAVAVPLKAEVVVLGDTAFDAQVIRTACKERNFQWVVPANPERVLAGAKPRPKVTSLVKGFTAAQFAPVRLVAGQGPFAAQRRVARCRLGPKAKARRFYIHSERREVHSVGEVLLVFSTKEKPESSKPVRVQKVLMTNAVTLTAARVVELYDLRWQVELFFKELKGTLGFHQYRFRQFAKVEGWAQACLVTFVYLEWYRAKQLQRRRLTVAERRWWQWQRSHGLCQALRQEAEDHDVEQLWEWSQTRTGRKKLRRCLQAARPREYQPPQEKQRKPAA